MQRKEPVASTRFLAAQLHELHSRPAAAGVGRQSTPMYRSQLCVVRFFSSRPAAETAVFENGLLYIVTATAKTSTARRWLEIA